MIGMGRGGIGPPTFWLLPPPMPRRICDIYDFFAPHIMYLLTYLLTYCSPVGVYLPHIVDFCRSRSVGVCSLPVAPVQGDVLDGRSTLRRRRLPAVVVRLEVDAGQHVLRRHLHVGDGLCVLDDRRAQQLRGLRRQSQRGLASSREMCPAVLRLAVQVERRPLRDSDLLHLRIRLRSLDQTSPPTVAECGSRKGEGGFTNALAAKNW